MYVLFTGDDVGGVFTRKFYLTIDTSLDLTDCVVQFTIGGVVKTLPSVRAGERAEIVFSRVETQSFGVGMRVAKLAIFDPQGRYRTIANDILVKCTDVVSEVYDGENNALSYSLSYGVSWDMIDDKPDNLATTEDIQAAKQSIVEALDGLEVSDTATQREVRAALQSLLERLRGIVSCAALLLSLCAFGIDSTTEWQDVPPTSAVSVVVGQFSAPDYANVSNRAMSAVTEAQLEGYKQKQEAVDDPNIDGVGIVAAAIVGITQDENGVIAPVKKTLPTATALYGGQDGLMSGADKSKLDAVTVLTSAQLAKIAAVSSATAFDAAKVGGYEAGEAVVYNGTLYTFTTEHTGEWIGTDADAVDVVALINALAASKANNADVVHTTGDENVGGVKTFDSEGVVVHDSQTGFSMKLLDTGIAVTDGSRTAYFYVPNIDGDGGTFALLSDVMGKANRDNYATDGNLAKFNSNGDPVDSNIPATNVVTKAMIDANNVTFSNAVLAVGLGIDTNTVAVINELVDSANDLPVSGATSVGALLLALAAAVAALKKRLPYALVTKTISNGAVSLDDHAMNAVEVSSALASLTINFPTATSGKVRDFGLRLTVASGITTAPELALPQGVTCENADGAAPEIGADGAATILYFTETASGVFLVKGETVQTIS